MRSKPSLPSLLSGGALSMKEVEAPFNFFCRSGHRAPPVFQREPKTPATPTKFFSVSSNEQPEIQGVYCELCLIVARAISRGEVQVK